MKERPILFSAPMVRALLAGTKTQTRRIFKARNGGVWPNRNDIPGMEQILRNCQYGKPGDRLWVRETFAHPDRRADNLPPWVYAADYADRPQHAWKPSIHMPRAASRITLEITSIRVERLQDISEDDAIAEGAPGYEEGFDAPPPDDECEWSYVASFMRLWDSIYGAGSSDANPWVWVVEFRRVEGGAA